VTATITPRAGASTPARGSLSRRFFGLAVQPRSYGKIAYLLLGLPLGVAWFAILTTGMAVGLGTIVALVGLLLLLAVWFLVRAFANLERSIANVLLGQHLAAAPLLPPHRDGRRLRVRTMIADRERWRELAYLLVRFPLGTATAVVTTTVLMTPVAIAWIPITARRGHDRPFGDWAFSDTLERVGSSSWAWLLVPVGGALLIAAVHAINTLAGASARFNMAWLGQPRPTTEPTPLPAPNGHA
jgi:hypothetical protein